MIISWACAHLERVRRLINCCTVTMPRKNKSSKKMDKKSSNYSLYYFCCQELSNDTGDRGAGSVKIGRGEGPTAGMRVAMDGLEFGTVASAEEHTVRGESGQSPPMIHIATCWHKQP